MAVMHSHFSWQTRAFVYISPARSGLRFTQVPHRRSHADAIQRYNAEIVDANSPDPRRLSKSTAAVPADARHGRMAIPPAARRVLSESQKTVSSRLVHFRALLLAPGFGHGDGMFRVLWDSLTALDKWVESGTPPANQVVMDPSQPGGGRTRPCANTQPGQSTTAPAIQISPRASTV